jgi:hypothetical protein
VVIVPIVGSILALGLLGLRYLILIKILGVNIGGQGPHIGVINVIYGYVKEAIVGIYGIGIGVFLIRGNHL